jgi:hypothetical protein
MVGELKCFTNNCRPNRKKPASAAFYDVVLICLTAFLIYGCATDPLTKSAHNTSNAPYPTSTFGLNEITTFDVYVNNETIHLLAGGKMPAKNKLIGLRYTQSIDGGQTWGTPITVTNPASIINSRGNDIQLAAIGDHLLTLWQTKGELPGMGPLVSANSPDNGNTWNMGNNPAVNNSGDQSHSDLIADSKGHFHAVWLEDPEENGYQSLRYAHSDDHGVNWSNPVTIEDSTCSCCWNSFAISPANDDLNILYRDMKPRDMALMRSSDDDKTWHRISTVGAFGWQFDGCPHVGGGLAYSDKEQPGHLHSLSWTGKEGKSGLYHLVSNDNGQHWSTPFMLGNQALHGDIAVFEGNVVAVWDETEDGESRIYYATSGDNGTTWSAPKKITQTNTSASHPRLAVTAFGILALWTEKSGKTTSQLAWQLIDE